MEKRFVSNQAQRIHSLKTTLVSKVLRLGAGIAAVILMNVSQPSLSAEQAKKPQDVAQLFSKYFNKADIDGLMSLYAPDSIFVPAPGQALNTPEGIRAAVQQFLGLKLPIAVNVRYVFETQDTALIISDWSIKGNTADGKPMDLSGTGTDVVRRGKDGVWRYLIDNPFGGLNPAK